MKRLLTSLLVIGLIVVAVTGCSGSQQTSSTQSGASDVTNSASDKKIVITFGGTLPDENPLTQGMYKFKEDLEARTNGQIEVQVFPNNQMGGGREMLESLQQGNLTMVECSIGPLSTFDTTCTVFNLPYLFYTREQVYDFMDNYPISAELRQRVEDKTGIKMLAFWENGYRQITNSVRSIQTAEDLEGVKIRTMENRIHIETFKSWGANPTPMAFGELFTALQQKTVDGQENPLPNIASQKFEEVQKYLTISDHFYDPDGLYINADFYNGLPEDLQKAIDDSAKVATDYQRQMSREADERLHKVYQESDKIEYSVLPDSVKQQLLEKAQPVYEMVKADLGPDLYDRIMETIDEIKAKK
ncbi:DctP family TRAP transporter solute-binding subunit [Oscillospiraceae bacterium LTW-04]|nr:DctP family TRAP transporter solute-binding subunit [Oscillospiraceae bacterium MB24-C1]